MRDLDPVAQARWRGRLPLATGNRRRSCLRRFGVRFGRIGRGVDDGDLCLGDGDRAHTLVPESRFESAPGGKLLGRVLHDREEREDVAVGDAGVETHGRQATVVELNGESGEGRLTREYLELIEVEPVSADGEGHLGVSLQDVIEDANGLLGGFARDGAARGVEADRLVGDQQLPNEQPYDRRDSVDDIRTLGLHATSIASLTTVVT